MSLSIDHNLGYFFLYINFQSAKRHVFPANNKATPYSRKERDILCIQSGISLSTEIKTIQDAFIAI